MKTISKALIVVATCVGSLNAQTDPEKVPQGFIRIVNAVASGTGPVNVLFDGEETRPKGYKLGDATGGIGLKPNAFKDW